MGGGRLDVAWDFASFPSHSFFTPSTLRCFACLVAMAFPCRLIRPSCSPLGCKDVDDDVILCQAERRVTYCSRRLLEPHCELDLALAGLQQDVVGSQCEPLRGSGVLLLR